MAMESNSAEAMEGIESTNVEQELPLLTEQETAVLALYDRLEELQLEIEVLKAQGVISQDTPRDVTEKDIEAAKQEFMKAKAVYQVRGNIIDSVLVATPILKSIHAGRNATALEQDLLPLLEKRDEASVSLSSLSAKVFHARNEKVKVESEHVKVARKNVELAATMFQLADKLNTHKVADIQDEKVREQLNELTAAMKISRQRWRIMKGTISATIAGSGVDWARNPKLLELVLDDDGEEG